MIIDNADNSRTTASLPDNCKRAANFTSSKRVLWCRRRQYLSVFNIELELNSAMELAKSGDFVFPSALECKVILMFSLNVRAASSTLAEG